MKGVLLMAYGSPRSMEGVEAYYTHIRGGRNPPPDHLEDLVRRYEAIGGPSSLLRITEAQADGLRRALQSSGSTTKVYAGMKHSEPFISEVVASAKADGVSELLCIALAPHYSSISIGGYIRAVEEANGASGTKMKLDFVKSWHDNPLLVSMWASEVREMTSAAGKGSETIFSAHSLPERIIKEGDPYRDELLRTSALVAEAAGGVKWSFAFQSASKTGEPWLG